MIIEDSERDKLESWQKKKTGGNMRKREVMDLHENGNTPDLGRVYKQGQDRWNENKFSYLNSLQFESLGFILVFC